MKIALHITAYKRLRLTAICYHGIKRLQKLAEKMDAELIPIIIYSEYEHKVLADSFGFHSVYAENFPVSFKHNAGLDYICRNINYDYILQVGSDDLISDQGLQIIYSEMQRGTLFFGFQQIIAAHALNNQMKVFNYHLSSHLVLGLGRCFSKQLIERLGPSYYCRSLMSLSGPGIRVGKGECFYTDQPNRHSEVIKQEYILWPQPINSGLDNSSQKFILNRASIIPKIITTDEPVLMDIKGFESISDYDNWKGEAIPWNNDFSPEVPMIEEILI